MSILRALTATATLVSAIMTFTSSNALAMQLGDSKASVRAAYSGLAEVRLDGGGEALELKDIDYAGVHWKTVEFVFDASNRLASVQMNSRSASLDQVQKIVMDELDQRDAGIRTAADEGRDTLQIRVCEGDDDGVTLTLEPLSIQT